MARISLPNGKWFDPSKAIEFSEDTNWNGNNHISVNTGSQWDHETLYYTKSGVWVLHHSSQWQGSTPSYEVIDENQAAGWLVLNGCIDDAEFDDLPADVQGRIKAHVDDSEV
jgi:hypothetical protein